jgi:hypothetical protein
MATPTAKRHDTEESRMSKAAPVSPIKPSPRRVLGELTPNARTTPRQPLFGAKENTKQTAVRSPLKLSQALTPHAISSDEENHVVSTQTSSKKRTIEDVEEPEEQASPVKRSPAKRAGTDASGAPPFPAGLARPPVNISNQSSCSKS